jgi:hypothetical protein
MAYHPTFAFFLEPIAVREVARALSKRLRDLELRDEEIDRELRFSLVGAQDEIEVWLMTPTCLSIKFWEFESALYDDGISREMVEAKRGAAEGLHVGLLDDCGACLSYTTYNDSSAARVGAPVEDAAAAIATAMHEKRWRDVETALWQEGPWLLGVRGLPELERSIRARGSLRTISAPLGARAAVFENDDLQPFFLSAADPDPREPE